MLDEILNRNEAIYERIEGYRFLHTNNVREDLK